MRDFYSRLEARWEREGVPVGQEWLAALTERETANSLEALTVALGDDLESQDQDPLEETAITNELESIDADLDSRWRGALFALSPRNPDAARDFCTSVREIFDPRWPLHSSHSSPSRSRLGGESEAWFR